MGNFLRIRCLVPTSVMIEDMSVRLVGKGAEVTVMASAAEASHDLRACLSARQVSLFRVGPEVWPVAGPVVLPELPPLAPKSVQPPPPAPDSSVPAPGSSPDFLRMLSSIDQSLKALLLRPSPPPAEEVAAHVKAISPAFVPDRTPSVAPAAHPQFIPSAILPRDANAGADIKVRKSDTGVGVDDSVSALKKLREKK